MSTKRLEFAQVTSTTTATSVVDLVDIARGERQTLDTTGTVTGGTFDLTLSGQTATLIDWDATAGEIKTAIESLSNVSEVATGGGPLPGTPVTVDFKGSDDIALMTADSANLTGTAPVVTVAETTAGRGGLQLDNVEEIRINPSATLAIENDTAEGTVDLANSVWTTFVGVDLSKLYFKNAATVSLILVFPS